MYVMLLFQTANSHSAGGYILTNGKLNATLDPRSVVTQKPEWCIFHEIALTSMNVMVTVTGINKEWLLEIAPKYYESLTMASTTSQGSS